MRKFPSVFLATGDTLSSVNLLNVFLDIRRVRAVCLFPFDIINPVTYGKRAITKKSSFTLAIAKHFPAKKKSGHL